MKRVILLLFLIFCFSSCTPNIEEVEHISNLINPAGVSLEERILTPQGFSRMDAESGSLTEFLRKFEMKENGGEPLLLYSGKKKGNQNSHAAIFNLPMEEKDLQQCADSVMRVYAEYYFKTEQYEKIAFHFTNGFLCEYEKWREGYRVQINGNDATWVKTASRDDSYETFVSYLHTVFRFAGTLSMDSLESETVSLSDLSVGDIIIKGGTPGHVVMVVDVSENEAGEKAFLLAQGYMPAQEFHVIKNPLHEDDPWYYEKEMTFPLKTAEYTFQNETMLKRPIY